MPVISSSSHARLFISPRGVVVLLCQLIWTVMYVSPHDIDVFSIPEVVGKMPNKYIHLRKSDYGCYNVIELPVSQVQDPFAKIEFEVMKWSKPNVMGEFGLASANPKRMKAPTSTVKLQRALLYN
ncbi:hypothetical protein SUGI_0024370 [Cryptomeria japonica]|nr:hypothetical protein SUGI_0024370 [Cryptomeria japonica]